LAREAKPRWIVVDGNDAVFTFVSGQQVTPGVGALEVFGTRITSLCRPAIGTQKTARGPSVPPQPPRFAQPPGAGRRSPFRAGPRGLGTPPSWFYFVMNAWLRSNLQAQPEFGIHVDCGSMRQREPSESFRESHGEEYWAAAASKEYSTVILRIPGVNRKHHSGAMSKAGWCEDLDPKGATAESARKRFRVVVADDRQDLLEEIRCLIAPQFDVVGSVNEGLALIQAACELRPDAIISDIHMPRLNGIDAGRQILQKGLCQAVIVLTMYNEPQFVDRAMQAGIRGYVLKVEAGEELIPALETVLGGGIYLSRGVWSR
jgi:CheY-like chemotaxis protein